MVNRKNGKDNKIEATVQKIVQGKHGPYAVATAPKIVGSITFAIKEGILQEDILPEAGSIVFLSNIIKKREGWRAMKARFLRPTDTKGTLKQQPNT